MTPALATAVDAAPACPNCAQPLAQPQLPFCPACGQETRVQAPTIGEFAQQFGGAYFATEGALWRTLKLLLVKPGELTRLYLTGRRKHYVLPLRLYLTISFMTLLLIRVATQSAPIHIEADQLPRAAEQANVNIGLGPARAGLKDGTFYCDGLPDAVCARLRTRLDIDPKSMANEMTQFRDRFVGNLGLAMFVLMPGFALWMKLAYLGRRMRYTEHLVFALHTHAFWFIALALALIDQAWLSFAAMIAIPWYGLAAMRRVYGGRRWPRLLRAAFVSSLYGLTVVTGLAGVAVWSLLF